VDGIVKGGGWGGGGGEGKGESRVGKLENEGGGF
jgi:hypothetical protein